MFFLSIDTEQESPSKEGLREGFTTGTAATAATCAALYLLLLGEHRTSVNVLLPPFPPEAGEPERRWNVPVLAPVMMRDGGGFGKAEPYVGVPGAAPDVSVSETGRTDGPNCEPCGESATGSRAGEVLPLPYAVGRVIKDGGDDPDATHGAVIEAHVRLLGRPGESAEDPPMIILEGGEGVGRVTLPGLPVAVGEAAINPEPRKQIVAAVRAVCAECGYSGAVQVCIVVPEGAERAKRTLNGRLGILGGISILGTRGTVRPFSHSSWKATISQGMDVARAAGCTAVGLSTGRRSERLLMAQYPQWPELAFVQAADFVAFSLEQAAEKGFSTIAWGCFFGKLVKLAQGHAYTHAQTVPIDFALLAQWCRRGGVSETAAGQILGANTARQVLEIIERESVMRDVVLIIADIARTQAVSWTGGVDVAIHVFDFDGRQLVVV